MNRSRVTGDLASHGNIFVDIANDRVGIGSTIPGQKLSLPDSAKIALGNSADLTLYHDGTNSYVNNTTGTSFYLANTHYFTNPAVSEIQATFVKDGAVKLYHNGSQKFETTNTGATISGTLISDGLTLYDNEKLLIGNNTDIEVFHDGTNSIFQSDTGDLQINSGNSAGNVEINLINNVAANTRVASAKFIKQGAVELYHNGSKKFETTSTGVKITGSNSTGTESLGDFRFENAAGTQMVIFEAEQSKMRHLDNIKATFGTGDDLEIYHTGSGSVINDVGQGYLHLRTSGSNRINIQPDNVQLCHSGNSKLETVGYGVTVLGTTETQGLNVTGVSTFSTVGVGSTAVVLDNSHKMTFGSAHELEMYHDGSNSYIKQRFHAYPSSLNIISENSQLNLMSGSGGNQHGGYENAITCHNNSHVKLYYGGTLALQTTGYGAEVLGSLLINMGQLRIQDEIRHDGDSDTKIRFPSPDTFSVETAGSERLRIDSGGIVTVNHGNATSNGILKIAKDSNGEAQLRFETASVNTASIVLGTDEQLFFKYGGTEVLRIDPSSNLILTSADAGSSAAPEFKLYRNSASPADADYLGQIKFAGESDTGVERNYAKITGKILDASNGTEDGILEFSHIKAGSEVITGRFRSDSLQLLNSTNFSVAGTSEFTGAATFNGSINSNAALNIGANSHITLATGNWAGNAYGKIQHHANRLYLGAGSNTDPSFVIRYDGSDKIYMTSGGTFYPTNDSSSDLGKPSVRWANGYFDTLYGDGSNLTGITQTTINSNADNRVITGSGTANTLNAESGLLWNSTTLTVSGSTNQKIILQGSTHPYIHFYEGTTAKAYMQWHADGYVRIRNDEDGSTILLKDDIQFSPDSQTNNYKMWHAGNDGSGSGLDADSLDGIGSDGFVRSNVSDTISGDMTFTGGADAITITSSEIASSGSSNWAGDPGSSKLKIQAHSNRWYIVSNGNSNRIVQFRQNGTDRTWIANDGQIYHGSGGTGDKYWRQGNDGSGSGLDSDTVDGLQASQFIRSDTDDTITKGSTWVLTHSLADWAFRFSNGNGSNAHVYMCHGTHGMHIRNDSSGTSQYLLDVYANNGNRFRVRGGDAYTTINGSAVWHAGNDGSGSGLDSDTVDGIQGSSFLRSDTNDVLGGVLSYHSNDPRLQFRNTSYNTYLYIGGWSSTNSNGISRIRNSSDNLHIDCGAQGSLYLNNYSSKVTYAADIRPKTNNSYDLGSSSNRWRDLYINDLALSNESKKDTGGNDVDGSWGDWRIQEGESDLFIINNRNGKKYKFNLTEVS